MTTPTEVAVPQASRLADGESCVFTLAFQGKPREAFVLQHDGELVAFLNECPHWAVELDLGDGHFYDVGIERIYCKNHGALFHPRTGVCETGPCLGRSLIRFALRRDESGVWVDPAQVLP
ncbi:MAG TPA: Rieske 2Fe-2S domain-containing protein [Polyangiaceae bacterium]|nr:Rieske 2Fe-2S domain-containing protein [Polyangiaceae bacterium]